MPTIRLVKHVERGSFVVILYRIAKNLLRRGHGKNFQLILLHTMGQEGGDSAGGVGIPSGVVGSIL